jgi:hypothetical protein
MHLNQVTLTFLLSHSLAASLPHAKPWADTNSVWRLENFNSLLTFGDSYTDENRIRYIAENNSTSEWEPKLTLYNYAVSGAVCSNEITPRYSFLDTSTSPSTADTD